MFSEIKEQAAKAVTELLAAAKAEPGDIFVVGCSTSEVKGAKLGTESDTAVAKALFDAIYPILCKNGLYIAAQCCEHLDRALIIEKEAAKKYGLTICNAIPQPKAGGSFAYTTYNALNQPCIVPQIHATAGIDIGGVLIGMHLRRTAVPVRTSVDKIGSARILCARTRPPFIGGVRAIYDEELL